MYRRNPGARRDVLRVAAKGTSAPRRDRVRRCRIQRMAWRRAYCCDLPGCREMGNFDSSDWCLASIVSLASGRRAREGELALRAKASKAERAGFAPGVGGRAGDGERQRSQHGGEGLGMQCRRPPGANPCRRLTRAPWRSCLFRCPIEIRIEILENRGSSEYVAVSRPNRCGLGAGCPVPRATTKVLVPGGAKTRGSWAGRRCS
jgi:hypothetical protein